MSKRQIERTQDVMIVNSGDIERVKLEADVLYVSSPSTTEAWELDPNQQAQNEKTGQYTQFVTGTNRKPLKIFKNVPEQATKPLQTIAGQKFDEYFSYLEEKNQKQSMLLWIGIITVIIAVTIGIVVLVNMN